MLICNFVCSYSTFGLLFFFWSFGHCFILGLCCFLIFIISGINFGGFHLMYSVDSSRVCT